jgi:hypothetical protein
MLLRLGIDDDEFEDFIYDEEDGVSKERMKWMALAKVHTANTFSPQAFEHNTGTAWRIIYSLSNAFAWGIGSRSKKGGVAV